MMECGFDTDVDLVLCADSAGKVVVDVRLSTPILVDMCEDLHDDEVDLGDEWRQDQGEDEGGARFFDLDVV